MTRGDGLITELRSPILNSEIKTSNNLVEKATACTFWLPGSVMLRLPFCMSIKAGTSNRVGRLVIGRD